MDSHAFVRAYSDICQVDHHYLAVGRDCSEINSAAGARGYVCGWSRMVEARADEYEEFEALPQLHSTHAIAFRYVRRRRGVVEAKYP